MGSKWRTAYELVRYTGFSFFNYDRHDGTIWLKNPKDRSVLCLNDVEVTEEQMELTNQDILMRRNHIEHLAGFEVRSIQCVHMTENKIHKKYKKDGLKIIHRGIADMKQVIRNPFFRLDMEYKKARPDDYYQRRLMGQHPFEKYMLKFTPVTYLLICLNLIVFLFNFTAIRLFDSYLLTNGLALSHFNVITGDLYRLLTSSFLHMTIDHFLFNIFALYILGKFVESLYGRMHLLTAYVLTGVLSSLFSLMFVTEGISLGASGAVYGLLGIIIVHLLANGRINAKLIIQIAVIFAAVSVLSGLFANINHAAHVGGLIFGVLLGVIYNPGKFNRKWLFGAVAAFLILAGVSYFVMSSKESPQPLDDLALEHISNGEYDEALSVVNEALRSGSGTSSTYHVLGVLSSHSGDHGAAADYHDKSYEMNPQNELAAKQKLIHLRKNRQYEEMGIVLEDFNPERIEDEGLRMIAEEYYGNE